MGNPDAFSELLKIESKLVYFRVIATLDLLKRGLGKYSVFCARVILFSGSLAWQVFDDHLFLGAQKKK